MEKALARDHSMRPSTPSVRIDTGALRRAIGTRKFDRIERDHGLSIGTICHIMRRGSVGAAVLDDLCGALGIHESEVVA